MTACRVTMWVGVVLALLLPGSWAQYPEYYEAARDGDSDFYDEEYAEETTTTYTMTVTTDLPSTELDSHTRHRRYGRYETIRTLNPDEIRNVKGILNDIIYGTKFHNLSSPAYEIRNSYTDIYDYVAPGLNNVSEQERVPNRNVIIRKSTKTAPRHIWTQITDQKWKEETMGDLTPEVIEHQSGYEGIATEWSPEATVTQWRLKSGAADYSSDVTELTETQPGSTGLILTSEAAEKWSPKAKSLYSGLKGIVNAYDSDPVYVSAVVEDQAFTTTDANVEDIDGQQYITIKQKPRLRQPTTDLTTTEPMTTTLTTTVKSTKPPVLDIDAIIAIIANLTYDYEWNLTERFNLTLMEHGVPTCASPTPSTVTTTTTTPPPYDFTNTSVVSKCFVCGLTETEIPRSAYCSDAFAGDFLPLVPIEPRARSKIATYRKYCRFLDVHNYVVNPSEARSIYGRFTGGCGVRWTDLTGIYTQRTCRNRYRPLMGKHFASKRMAKLEMALVNVDDGCIISPMATLLPLSRGISLYARFHACVCSGNWCNKAIRIQQWKAYITILWYWFTSRIWL
ncbi:unnamed protein product [Chrysodeixis includens]|uniref:Uncharacterized protein n=1 Tax=Chrysodeixis includens TaxID=689277 RepID=A0A9P0C203_CHRIL|nr:unnamed protein product [Chrysodeixis includens]